MRRPVKLCLRVTVSGLGCGDTPGGKLTNTMSGFAPALFFSALSEMALATRPASGEAPEGL